MIEETRFASKIRSYLEEGTSTLDPAVLMRLRKARSIALNVRNARVFTLADIAASVEQEVFSYAKILIVVLALSVSTVGTYYWNGAERAQEHDEIDSALLTDELPPTAYLDPGFQAWLKPSADSSLP